MTCIRRIGRIMWGGATAPLSVCRQGGSIWSRCSIGTRATSWPGNSTRCWNGASYGRRPSVRSRSGRLRSGTATRAAMSPARSTSRSWRAPRSGSAWTARAARSTTSSPSGCGAPSSKRRCIATIMPAPRRRARCPGSRRHPKLFWGRMATGARTAPLQQRGHVYVAVYTETTTGAHQRMVSPHA